MEESEASIPTSIWSTINNWFTPTILFIFLNLMIATILFTSNLPNNNNNINTKKKHQDQKQKQEQEPQLNQTDHVQSKLPGSQSILHRLKSFNVYPQISQPPQPQQQHEQEDTLETVATEYVFNHPFPHQQDLLQPLENEATSENANPKKLDLDPTQIDLDPTRFDPDPTHLDDTYEVPPSTIQTHFVLDKHTVEKVTTHYDFGPTRIENENPDINEEEKDELQSLDEVYSIISGGGHVNRTMSDTIPASGEVPVKLPSKMKKSASLKSAFSHFEEEKIVEARRPATVREHKTATEDDDDAEVDAKADDFINKFKHQLKLQRLDSIIRYKDMVNRGTQK